MEALRTCNKCDLKAFTRDDLEEFQRANNARYGRANICKECAVKKTLANNALKPPRTAEQEAVTRKSQRKWHLKKTYNLTLEDFGRMLEEQDYCCKICKCDPYNVRNAFREHLVVDHCHETGTVRGLLCAQCNTGLGKFKDDPELVAIALDYLNTSEFLNGDLA